MKDAVDYKDIEKEIVGILTKYESTASEVERVLGWLNDVMTVRPIHESTD